MWRRFFPVRWTLWLGPLIAAIVVCQIGAILLVTSGLLDLTATSSSSAGLAGFLHYTFRRSVAHHASDISIPADLDSADRVRAGALYYGQVCAHCHGGPGFGQNQVALSMAPRPQFLPAVTGRFTPQQLFWIVRHGVSYSAMPGWPAEGRDDEVWHLVAYLRAQPQLSGDQFRALAMPRVAASNAPMMFGETPPARRYRMWSDSDVFANESRFATPALGFSSIALGDDPVRSCVACHGVDGRGGGIFPNLAIQDATYLTDSLNAFARGTRRSGFMQIVAAQLSPDQIAALAAYYAAQPKQRTESGVGASVSAPLELRIVVNGCEACHGVTRAVGKWAPRLQGQSRWYLDNQMRLFAGTGRGSTSANPMRAIARRLTSAQIAAVASWYAAQPPRAVSTR